MKIEIRKSATKDLKKISEPFKAQIKKAVWNLMEYPNVPNIKKLVNHEPIYRLRVGNYRVLFDIKDDVIIVSKIKHRRESY